MCWVDCSRWSDSWVSLQNLDPKFRGLSPLLSCSAAHPSKFTQAELVSAQSPPLSCLYYFCFHSRVVPWLHSKGDKISRAVLWKGQDKRGKHHSEAFSVLGCWEQDKGNVMGTRQNIETAMASLCCKWVQVGKGSCIYSSFSKTMRWYIVIFFVHHDSLSDWLCRIWQHFK